MPSAWAGHKTETNWVIKHVFESFAEAMKPISPIATLGTATTAPKVLVGAIVFNC